MDNNWTSDNGEPKSFKWLQCSNRNKNPIQEDVAPATDSYHNSRNEGETNEEVEESLQSKPWNDEQHLGTRLSNPPQNLKSRNVGLSFQSKMLKFMDSMNQKLKHGREERV